MPLFEPQSPAGKIGLRKSSEVSLFGGLIYFLAALPVSMFLPAVIFLKKTAGSGFYKLLAKDRDFLLKIKSGAYSYEDLVQMANEKVENINLLYLNSDLPEMPDISRAERLPVKIREAAYSKTI
jgi:hypothetical protein